MDSLCPTLLGQTLMTTASEMFPQQVLVPCLSSSAPPRLCPLQSLPVSTSIKCKYFCLVVKTVCHLPLKPAGPPTCPVSHLVPLGLLSRSSFLHMSLQDPKPTPCIHRPRPVALPASSNHALHSTLPVPLCVAYIPCTVCASFASQVHRHRDCSLSILKLQPDVT